MKQQTLTGFEKYGKTTRRAQFLADMERIIPWRELSAAIEPVYPKVSEAGGRPPIPLERMLRIYFLQLWFNLCVANSQHNGIRLHSAVLHRMACMVAFCRCVNFSPWPSTCWSPARSFCGQGVCGLSQQSRCCSSTSC